MLAVVLCSAIPLAACVETASVEPARTHTPAAPATPDFSYLDDVGEDGLIEGKTYGQLVGPITYDCMVDNGWVDLVLDEDGSFGGTVPPEQREQYQADLEDCDAKAQLKYPMPETTEDDMRERYVFELETRKCLMAQGYPISEPPSVEKYIEQNQTGELWMPYSELPASLKQAEYKRLREVCPDPAYRFY
ncbi:hypothetical protein GCM10025870_17850 [Agromyces marinus]|uniref:Uncharacterized protein n=1 Tax=Agromyces marinus TaxID=1389020 RepID=A0ABN6YBG2_9MICO|nr:hypothetical protein GCM10025870_17850 [Agromyces marinus]